MLYRELEAESRKEWLVSGLLGSGDASAFYGVPGCGKSMLVEDMALHIAAGREWHGRMTKQGAVLYVALERKTLVERRAIAFRTRYGDSDLPFAVIGGVYDFRDPKTTPEVLKVAREVETDQRIVLVLIDTISCALCGGDENSPKDMGMIVAAMSRLKPRRTFYGSTTCRRTAQKD
ncbi:MAG: AAA family ATPase [Pseudolabrys sp.]